MTLATLKLNPQNWDEIQILLHGDIARIITLKNRTSALELNRLLTIAHFEGHEGELSINIDGHDYTLQQNVWEAVLSVVDQWLARYLPEEYPDYFTDSDVGKPE